MKCLRNDDCASPTLNAIRAIDITARLFAARTPQLLSTPARSTPFTAPDSSTSASQGMQLMLCSQQPGMLLLLRSASSSARICP
ncbi:MAG: hypothetical protein DWI12_12870 [Planctomycetota bacterium]|nr:MAG: hypothetical protein DWI12_12870 [Planctomycetota bacterium]